MAFTVDDRYVQGPAHRGLPLVPFEEVERRFPPDDFRMLILLGYQSMNGLRADKYRQAKAKGYTLESYVASDIFRVDPLNIGENCFIMDNQSISLDVRIGNDVVMWSSNHIGDLSTIEDHAWISSHATLAAQVTIGERRRGSGRDSRPDRTSIYSATSSSGGGDGRRRLGLGFSPSKA